jgi:hypothetical protein
MSNLTRRLRQGLSDRLYGKGITIGTLGSDPETDAYIQEKLKKADANAEYLWCYMLEEAKKNKPSTESDKMDYVFSQITGIDSAHK